MDHSNFHALIPYLFILGIFIVAFMIFYIWFVWGNIFEKAGYSRIYCLFLLIPCGRLVATIIFAFSDWPVLQQLRMMYPPPMPKPPAPPPQL